jgi:hypothetical protein
METICRLFGVALLLFAQFPAVSAGPPERFQRAEKMFNERIPRLELKDATFEEALATIRKVWDAVHPGETFSVALIDFNLEGHELLHRPKFTVDWQNVTYGEALRDIAKLSHIEFEQNGALQSFTSTYGGEDWYYREFPLSDELLAKLEAHTGMNGKTPREIFTKLGIKFEPWMVSFRKNGVLLVANYQPQNEQIAGILHLVEQGFRISTSDSK